MLSQKKTIVKFLNVFCISEHLWFRWCEICWIILLHFIFVAGPVIVLLNSYFVY